MTAVAFVAAAIVAIILVGLVPQPIRADVFLAVAVAFVIAVIIVARRTHRRSPP
jgi:hypothetical protein